MRMAKSVSATNVSESKIRFTTLIVTVRAVYPRLDGKSGFEPDRLRLARSGDISTFFKSRRARLSRSSCVHAHAAVEKVWLRLF
jgi:hypothetical protein